LTELLQGRALNAVGGFPEPGVDLEEIAHSQNLEIHFVDSSGIISWNFLRDTPDFAFSDWNFSNTTASMRLRRKQQRCSICTALRPYNRRKRCLLQAIFFTPIHHSQADFVR